MFRTIVSPGASHWIQRTCSGGNRSLRKSSLGILYYILAFQTKLFQKYNAAATLGPISERKAKSRYHLLLREAKISTGKEARAVQKGIFFVYFIFNLSRGFYVNKMFFVTFNMRVLLLSLNSFERLSWKGFFLRFVKCLVTVQK